MTSGGTRNTIEFARKQHIEILFRSISKPQRIQCVGLCSANEYRHGKNICRFADFPAATYRGADSSRKRLQFGHIFQVKKRTKKRSRHLSELPGALLRSIAYHAQGIFARSVYTYEETCYNGSSHFAQEGDCMNQHYRDQVANEFRNCVMNTIRRIQKEATYRPFHSALLSDEALFWSRFERSFSTSFGQRVIEELARIAALSGGASDARRQVETFVTLDTAYVNAISDHIQSLRNGNRDGCAWDKALASIRAVRASGTTVKLRIISDMWWRKDGIDHYISLKTVKPNIDQTAVAKEDCLHLTIGKPGCHAYFGLPYNPYGERKADYAFNPPMGIFDFRHDPVVLIGREMWDTLGGAGCYDEILEIARQVGRETKPAIERIM